VDAFSLPTPYSSWPLYGHQQPSSDYVSLPVQDNAPYLGKPSYINAARGFSLTGISNVLRFALAGYYFRLLFFIFCAGYSIAWNRRKMFIFGAAIG